MRPLDSPAALQEFMRSPYPLSEQQFAAVTAPLRPGLVVAGAGSGKTTLMAARVVWLVGTGQVAPEQVLGLTFTTKAAAELSGRVRTALRDAGVLPTPGAVPGADRAVEPVEPTVATYNSYAASLLREQGLRIGHEPASRVLTPAGRYQIAARVISRYDGSVRLLSDHPPTVINYVLALDSAMSEHLVSVADVRAFHRSQRPRFLEALETSRAKSDLTRVVDAIDRREELLGLVEGYRRLKEHLGVMEFSDQIELATRLAHQHPPVGAAEREKFRVVLLDEYQDTSVAQATMLSRLFSGATPQTGRGHPVTAVGDPKQAIYGWRGASVSNIGRFGDDFPAAGGDQVASYPLTVNRRSDRRILEVANELARPLTSAALGGDLLEAPAGAAPGTVRAEVFETYDEELAWLPGEVRAARDRYGAWREIGVLTRDNAHAADVFRALSDADVPVEIVGLKGLLALPEVAGVVATLTLLHDLTANAALLTLLTGPRWAIGIRDLALLGRRAEDLARVRRPRERRPDRTLAEELEEAVTGVDPTEVVSLAEALDDPGAGPYSAPALERFALLSAELRTLRSYAAEPLLDLVRRIIDTTGIDVELASSGLGSAGARRDNLDLFVKAVAEFEAVDGAVTLPALLAYLEAEDDSGGHGLDVATPTQADSVKLLTVHRAKGLEWDAVFLVGVCRDRFPTNRSRVKWTSGPAVLPNPLRGDARDLPVLRGFSKADVTAFAEDCRRHEAEEELRLGYVAFTRPRHELVVSSYCWTSARRSGLGPSPYQQVLKTVLESQGEPVGRWREAPDKADPNPLLGRPLARRWPVEGNGDEVRRRLAAADLVRNQIDRLGQVDRPPRGEEPEPAPTLSVDEAELVAGWDAELARLLEEARAGAVQREVVLPSSMSATSLARVRDAPDELAAALARPMPRRPSPAARFGTRFHAWVEAYYDSTAEDPLVDPDDLPGRADLGIDDEGELEELVAKFRSGPFAERRPLAVEPSFAVVLAGQVVRGRIDAVFAEDDGTHLVVDWKTSRPHSADPVQLAVYRLAWAELHQIPVQRVRAAFYYVRDGEVVEPENLPDRRSLEQLLTGSTA